VGLKKLAEAMILQQMEDLWDPDYRLQSMEFISGRDFHLLMEMAEMGYEEKLNLMKLLKKISSHTRKNTRSPITTTADRADTSPHALSAPPSGPAV